MKDPAPARPSAPADPGLHAALRTLQAPPALRPAGLAVIRTGRPPGTAPTVLLVHGLGSDRSAWAPVLHHLASRYDVVAIDLPGHGANPPWVPGDDPRPRALAASIARACAELGVARPHVVGNSLGGWAGLELAADGIAASLTALAPAGLWLAPGSPSPLLRLNRALAAWTAPVADTLLAWAPLRRAVFASGSAAPAGLDLGLVRAAAHAMRMSTGYGAMLDATAHVRFDRRADLRVPVTVAFGDRDRILPAPRNQRRELLPAGTRWVELPRCGHAPMWDAPARTVQLIDETVAAAAAG